MDATGKQNVPHLGGEVRGVEYQGKLFTRDDTEGYLKAQSALDRYLGGMFGWWEINLRFHT